VICSGDTFSWSRLSQRGEIEACSKASFKSLVLSAIFKEEMRMFDEPEEFHIWHAGEIAPAGIYVRIDDRSYQRVTLSEEGFLPASFDGHVALYRALAHVSSPGITEKVSTGRNIR
jgi:hypothetical protein